MEAAPLLLSGSVRASWEGGFSWSLSPGGLRWDTLSSPEGWTLLKPLLLANFMEKRAIDCGY